MSTILGNPITLGGGGANLNIDFGTTPPTDTTKLWIPLQQKPVDVEINGQFMTFGPMSLETRTPDSPVIPTYGLVKYAVTKGDYIYYTDAQSNLCKYSIDNKTSEVVMQTPSGLLIRCNLSFDCGSKIYICYGNSSSNYLYCYNTETGAAEGNRISLSWVGYSSIIAANGKAFIFNDGTSDVDDAVRELNLTTGSTTIVARNPHYKYNRKPIVWEFLGKIYLMCGGSASDSTIYLYTFDPETYIFTDLKSGRYSSFGLDSNVVFTYDEAIYDNFITKTVPIVVGNRAYFFFPTMNGRPNKYVYFLDLDTNMFSKTTDIYVEGSASKRTGFSLAVHDMTIYIFGGSFMFGTGTSTNQVDKFHIETYLPKDNLRIFTDMSYGTDPQTLLVNSSKAKLYANVRKAYIGNADGYARDINAYIYNESTSSWQAITGESLTQDMLNALATLGVT